MKADRKAVKAIQPTARCIGGGWCWEIWVAGSGCRGVTNEFPLVQAKSPKQAWRKARKLLESGKPVREPLDIRFCVVGEPKERPDSTGLWCWQFLNSVVRVKKRTDGTLYIPGHTGSEDTCDDDPHIVGWSDTDTNVADLRPGRVDPHPTLRHETQDTSWIKVEMEFEAEATVVKSRRVIRDRLHDSELPTTRALTIIPS